MRTWLLDFRKIYPDSILNGKIQDFDQSVISFIQDRTFTIDRPLSDPKNKFKLEIEKRCNVK